MKVYLVGGAVRDKLLGYPTDEYDYVVVGATPEEMQTQGFSPVGKDFPVFLHPKSKDEYALARTERKTGHGYQGFSFNAATNVTLEEDLSRRDLTINAIAQLDSGELVDPFNGQADIENKILRHVSDAFREDPVRVLRIARFACRYHHLGFSIAPETQALMQTMVDNGEVAYLVAERVWKEFSRALDERSPQIFLKVLHGCGALKIVMPQIDYLLSQNPATTIAALNYACQISDKSTIRLATTLHDLDKNTGDENTTTGHRAPLAQLTKLCERLMIPNEYRELCSLVIRFNQQCSNAFSLTPDAILDLLVKTDSLRRPQRFADFLLSCKAYALSGNQKPNQQYNQMSFLTEALKTINDVTPQALMAQGLSGKMLGDALTKARINKLSVFKHAWLNK